jgi:AraC-like DNA-binding protein
MTATCPGARRGARLYRRKERDETFLVPSAPMRQERPFSRRVGSMFFRFYCPTPQLAPFIHKLWLYQSDAQPQAYSRWLPSGSAQLIVDLSGDGLPVPELSTNGHAQEMARALFNGPDTQYFLEETGHPTYRIGVDFKPGGAYPFFRPPAGELRDAHLPLETLWGIRVVDDLRGRLVQARAPEERVQVLQEALLGRLAHPLERHPAVTLALRALAKTPRGPAIARLAQQTALSHRQFVSVFREEVGLGPKEFARVQRFYRAVRRARKEEPVDWSRLAAECGYYDQAHLINEFQTFSGLCPSEYLRDHGEWSA